jgi:hypothetical protein
MSDLASGLDVSALEGRVKDLERTLRVSTWAWLAAAGAVLLSRLLSRRTPQASETQTGVMRARQLIIVDGNGVERVVIGPIPDPHVQGKQMTRRSPATGVQLNDSSGNERAGIALLDDGTAVVGIDDELGAECAHLYYIPKVGSGLMLQGSHGEEKVSLLIPRDGAPPAGPRIEIVDHEGSRVISNPISHA